jgi:hypothetical protein
MPSIKAYMPDADIWKAGLRTAVAGSLALLIAQLLALPQGYWSVMTAIVIMQTRLGASLKAAGDRVLGTLAGAAFGFVVALLTPSTPGWTWVGLIVSIGVLGMLAAYRPSYRVAPMTAAIVLVATPSHAVALISATHRVTEILIGCAVGILVSLVVTPARSDTSLRNEANHAIGLLVKLIGLEIAGPSGKPDEAAVKKVNDQIYNSYRTIDTLTREVQEERASHISRGSLDPERLRLCLRDLRTSTLFLRRVTRLPWPASLDAVMAGPAKAVTDEIGSCLLAIGGALSGQVAPPPTDNLEGSFAAFASASRSLIEQASPAGSDSAGTTVAPAAIDDHAVAYLSNLSFALEQVRYSTEKLAECVADMSGVTDRS